MRPLRRLALVALLLAPALATAQTYGPKRDPMQRFFTPSLGDLHAEAAEARTAGKQAIFVMYVRDDCPYCERMKRNLLSLEAVQDYYREHFAVLAIDLRGAVPIVDFTGTATTEKAFAADQGVKFTPLIIFYDLDGRPVARHRGEIRDVREFMLLGRFVATGAYRSQSFAEYKQSSGSRKGS
ncbi:MAG TPA: thioredoxin family protein [Burkholderiales bacterium]|nr:thioredoxin family protein [Burkholderiales bacterium]